MCRQARVSALAAQRGICWALSRPPNCSPASITEVWGVQIIHASGTTPDHYQHTHAHSLLFTLSGRSALDRTAAAKICRWLIILGQSVSVSAYTSFQAKLSGEGGNTQTEVTWNFVEFTRRKRKNLYSNNFIEFIVVQQAKWHPDGNPWNC